MGDQYIFDVAEWLLYNAKDINTILGPMLDDWKKARDTLSENIPAYKMKYNADIKYKYEETIFRLALQQFEYLSQQDMQMAFEDERTRIILNKYYMEDL